MRMCKAKVPTAGSRTQQGHNAHRTEQGTGGSPKVEGSCCHIAYVSYAAEGFQHRFFLILNF